jgi:tetratricopeptide (TPR) repeat protein
VIFYKKNVYFGEALDFVHSIVDKSAKILIVDISDTSRLTVSAGLRDAGFTDTLGVANLGVALELLEAEPKDWIITSLYAGDSVSAEKLLKMCLTDDRFKNVHVSVLLLESELKAIPTAFQNGALSWHLRNYVPEHFNTEFNELNFVLEENKNDLTLLSGHYLRKHLRSESKNSLLVSLESELAKSYPGRSSQQLLLAEAEYINGDSESATGRLTRIISVEPECEQTAIDLAALYEVTLEKPKTEDLGKIFGLHSAMIVESGTESSDVARSLMLEMGVNTFEVKDYAEAVTSVDADFSPDVVIMVWDPEDDQGMIFIQRVKSKSELETDFLVIVSENEDWKDRALLSEMGVRSSLAKPVTRETLLAGMMKLDEDANSPKTGEAIEYKVRNLLKQNKLSEAEDIIAGLDSVANVSKGQRLLIEAQVHFANKRFDAAAKGAIESIESGCDTLFGMNFLGKCMMKKNNHEAALQCFKKAQEWSPKNLERMADISVSQYSVGQEEESQATLDSASLIDPDNTAVLAAEAAISIGKGDTEKAKTAFSKLSDSSGVLEMLNNQGVALTRDEKFSEGINFYLDALTSIPETESTARSQITYNLALAYAREGKNLEKALEKIREVLNFKKISNLIKAKSKSLEDRLIRALEHGESFAINNSAPTEKKNVEKMFKSGVFQYSRGERCLYRIFVNPDAAEEQIDSMLKFETSSTVEKDIEDPNSDEDAI